MSNSKLEGLTVDHNSIYYESQIEKEFISKKTITYVRANLDASAIIVPKVDSYPERRLLFKDKTCKDKRLLYRLVVAAYNHCFVSEFSALTAKVTFTGAVSSFVDWLNEIEISNRYSILKDYEAYIFDMRDNHGGASELPKIKIMLLV